MLGDALGEPWCTAAGCPAHADSRMSAITLGQPFLRWGMEIRPERGGRITSLRLDGEELLDQGIGVDQPTADGFVEGGAFGWDEMVPNLEPTDTLPDHGEAWRYPWEAVVLNRQTAGLRCRGRLLPWELNRHIVIPPNGVTITYRLQNIGAEPFAAFWAAHPLFKLEPGMEVGVPGLPEPAEGRSAKVHLAPGSIDRVSLRWRSGKGIELSWDPTLTPQVAIWICNGDLGGYHQIAVEPATASPQLNPGQMLDWWLQIRAL
jgi:hypothetical protein